MLRPSCSVSSDQRGFTLAELLVTMAVVGLIMAAVLSVQMSGATISQTSSNKAEAQQAARAAMMMEEDLRASGYGYPPPLSQITPPAGPNTTAAIITAASPTAITFMADVANASATLTAFVNAGATTLTVNAASKIVAGDTIYLINVTQAASLIVKTVAGNNITTFSGVICPGVPNPCYPAGAMVGRARTIAYNWDGVTLTLTKDFGDGAGPQPLATGVQAFQLRYFDASDAEIPPANLAANLQNIRRVRIDLTAQSEMAQNRGTFSVISSVRPRNL